MDIRTHNESVIDVGTLSRLRLSASRSTTYSSDEAMPTGCIMNHEQQRHHLKKLSDARVSRWGNTLAAQRTQRLEWKANKLETEEAEQVKLDAEAACEQEESRRQLIQRAEKLLHEETENARRMRVAQHQQEVAATLQLQMLDRQRMDQEEKIIDQQYHEGILFKRKEKERQDSEAKHRKERLSRELAKGLLDQKLVAHLKKKEAIEHCRLESQAITERHKAEDRIEADKHRSKLLAAKQKANIEIEKMQSDTMGGYLAKIKLEKEESDKRQLETDELVRLANGRFQLERQHFEARQKQKSFLSDQVAKDLLCRQNKQ
jgi:hypothetical protein